MKLDQKVKTAQSETVTKENLHLLRETQINFYLLSLKAPELATGLP